ncbi:MAG: LysR family transcriptional regulator, partial [Pseudomonas sp.]
MNFKQIETFRAVMVSGSMTAAAQALHTSQPNVSRLIAQLERANGFKLFERVGARLVPTDEGAQFFADVERAFIGLHSLENSAQHLKRGGTGRLRIGA